MLTSSFGFKTGFDWEKKKAFVIRLRDCRRLPPHYFIPGTPPEETNFKQVAEYGVCSTNVCAVSLLLAYESILNQRLNFVLFHLTLSPLTAKEGGANVANALKRLGNLYERYAHSSSNSECSGYSSRVCFSVWTMQPVSWPIITWVVKIDLLTRLVSWTFVRGDNSRSGR